MSRWQSNFLEFRRCRSEVPKEQLDVTRGANVGLLALAWELIARSGSDEKRSGGNEALATTKRANSRDCEVLLIFTVKYLSDTACAPRSWQV